MEELRDRELLHRERILAMVERGAFRRQLEPRDYLLRGLIWLFIGAGLIGFLFFVTGVFDGEDRANVIRWGFLGVIPAAVGLAYLVFYIIEGHKPRIPTP